MLNTYSALSCTSSSCRHIQQLGTASMPKLAIRVGRLLQIEKAFERVSSERAICEDDFKG